MRKIEWDHYINIVDRANPIRVNGKVTQVIGLVIEGTGPASSIGGMCAIYPQKQGEPIPAEIVGFRDHRILLMPLGDLRGIGPGSRIVKLHEKACTGVGKDLLGRVIDGLGDPIDGKGPIVSERESPIYTSSGNSLRRRRIRQPLDVGIRAINGFLTCGQGQRVAIMAGSGVGKSLLLGMIARNTASDVNVIALIGERGREVREFLENNLGEEGLKKSVLVVATSDQPPLVRMRGAFIATTIAEFFRSLGLQVVFMLDSITRFAMAQREVGLAIGEPPTTKGYTPSVFALLPKLLERVGTVAEKGSITGFYTVLVEGDDMNEPVADSVRSILDGHIVLSRELAAQNHYPAIDVLNSLSRVMIAVVSKEQKETANKLLSLLAVYKEAEDLINIGAYVKGSNPHIDKAIEMVPQINRYLQQGLTEQIDLKSCIQQLNDLLR